MRGRQAPSSQRSRGQRAVLLCFGGTHSQCARAHWHPGTGCAHSRKQPPKPHRHQPERFGAACRPPSHRHHACTWPPGLVPSLSWVPLWFAGQQHPGTAVLLREHVVRWVFAPRQQGWRSCMRARPPAHEPCTRSALLCGPTLPVFACLFLLIVAPPRAACCLGQALQTLSIAHARAGRCSALCGLAQRSRHSPQRLAGGCTLLKRLVHSTAGARP
jgi:hypothetical protein